MIRNFEYENLWLNSKIQIHTKQITHTDTHNRLHVTTHATQYTSYTYTKQITHTHIKSHTKHTKPVRHTHFNTFHMHTQQITLTTKYTYQLSTSYVHTQVTNTYATSYIYTYAPSHVYTQQVTHTHTQVHTERIRIEQQVNFPETDQENQTWKVIFSEMKILQLSTKSTKIVHKQFFIIQMFSESATWTIFARIKLHTHTKQCGLALFMVKVLNKCSKY